MTDILFVDIDETLTTTISGSPFKQHPRDVKAIPCADRAITKFKNKGYTIIGVSNQGGCSTLDPKTGKPYKTIQDTCDEMLFTLSFFPEIDSILFCPDMEGKLLWLVKFPKFSTNVVPSNKALIGTFRKPECGMINYILQQQPKRIFKANHLMVGDRPEDATCAVNAGIDFIAAQTWRMEYGK
jgi:D-glycero-D-manno-heptose 1,7-bisphosphate phosphatase